MSMGQLNEYVFHFTGKANQSYVMEKPFGEAVYEAEWGGFALFKDTTFTFRNLLTGIEEEKKVGKTATVSLGNGRGFSMNINSGFKIDKVSVWDVLYDMGFDFKMSMNGICVHYEIFKHGENIGSAELSGTGLFDPRHKDSKMGKVPTNGILHVYCAEEDIPGVFLTCFAITRTEIALNTI